jgi:hypothetical protein
MGLDACLEEGGDNLDIHVHAKDKAEAAQVSQKIRHLARFDKEFDNGTHLHDIPGGGLVAIMVQRKKTAGESFTPQFQAHHTIQSPGGSAIVGTTHFSPETPAGHPEYFHGYVKPTVHMAAQQAVVQGKKIVFLAEGRAGGFPGSEQEHIAQHLEKHFPGQVHQDTWDDHAVWPFRHDQEADAINPDRPVVRELGRRLGNPALAEAGLHAALHSQTQGKGLTASSTTQQILGSLGLHHEDKKSLYRAAYPEDSGDRPGPIAHVAREFNKLRRENLVNKVRQVEASGHTAIATPGYSHISDIRADAAEKTAGESPLTKLAFLFSRPATQRYQEALGRWRSGERGTKPLPGDFGLPTLTESPMHRTPESFVSRAPAALSPVIPQPKEVPLLPQQRQAVDFITAHGGSGILAHVTGAGKTRSGVEAAQALRRGGRAGKVLVIAPASLRTNFAMEGVKRFTDEPVTILGGAGERGPGYSPIQNPDPHANYYVVSYDAFRMNPDAILKSTGADTLILDEFHRVKDPTGGTFKAIARIRPKVKNVIGLTGSLISTHPTNILQPIGIVAGRAPWRTQEFEEKFVRRLEPSECPPGASQKAHRLAHLLPGIHSQSQGQG